MIDPALTSTPNAILQPIVVLIGWTLLMLGWTLGTRLPALRKAGIRMSSLVGTTASDADRSLPKKAQWKAHNSTTCSNSRRCSMPCAA